MSERQKRYVFFFILAVLFHWLFFWLVPLQTSVREPETAEALDLTLIKPYRIADIQKPEKEERPERADFAGLYDSRVKEEQVAPSPPDPGAPIKSDVREKMRELEETKKEEKDLAALYAMRKPSSKAEPSISPESFRREGTIPEDYFRDYKIGPHTYLNVLRFPEVQYFVRLKRIFKMTFNPVPSLREAFYANQVSRGQVEVVLAVTIDAQGKLARLFVINSSGLENYDREALRTVRDSSPFARPPKELLGKGGQLRMSWTFTVYL